MIAVCRLRHCARTQAYAARRTKEGKTKREIIRCLKRYIARETYHALTADLADLGQLQTPRPPVAPVSSAAAADASTLDIYRNVSEALPPQRCRGPQARKRGANDHDAAGAPKGVAVVTPGRGGRRQGSARRPASR
jgi:hypothetical protein